MATKVSKTNQQGKLIIFTAPSGAGKTTIVRHLIEQFEELAFSVSATNRERRPKEEHGRDYYFISTETFEEKVKNGDFMEWEEVYDGQYYGTLKSEIERIWALGKTIIFDIEVKGATHIKQAYPDNSLAVFIKPPSPEILFERLRGRRTENAKSLQKRIARAAEELKYENKFDIVLVNDILEVSLTEAERIVRKFIG
ncbi:MAG: guanylate kinase [Bacteroidota bacterium]